MEAEKGKTAKYLREQLGGVPEQAKNKLKAYSQQKKRIIEALKDEELTIKQLADKLEMPTHEVMYYLNSLVKFGQVLVGDIDDMDEYFTYKLNN